MNKKAKPKKDAKKGQPKNSVDLLSVLRKNQLFIASLTVMLLLGALILFMFSLYNHANDSSGEVESDTNISFDQKTIDQIKELNNFNDKVAPTLPSGSRIDPFAS